MEGTGFLVERAGPVTSLTMNRPRQRNAIGSSGWAALAAAIAAANDDPGCRVVILRGAGGHFGAGADIAEFATVFRTAGTTLAYFDGMEMTMRAIEESPKPVIAGIEGLCIGACVGLSLACDIRIASATASFAITPARLGIAYPYGDIERVVRAVGPGAARTLLFTGRRIDAGRAASIGLVDEVAAADGFEAALASMASEIAGNSHFTVRACKDAVRSILAGMGPQDARYPARLVEAVRGADFAEGTAAFLEKRAPRFRVSTP